MQRMRGFTASVHCECDLRRHRGVMGRRRRPSGPSAGTTGGGTALRIHVTAVQGGGQFRPDANSKWQKATEGLDLPEGVELRTGPKGSIQFHRRHGSDLSRGPADGRESIAGQSDG